MRPDTAPPELDAERPAPDASTPEPDALVPHADAAAPEPDLGPIPDDADGDRIPTTWTSAPTTSTPRRWTGSGTARAPTLRPPERAG